MKERETSPDMNMGGEGEPRDIEHLNEDIEPITANIKLLKDTQVESSEDVDFSTKTFEDSADDIEYDPGTDYVISLISERRKFTSGLANCTSLIVTGIEKATGNNVSFLTHQNDLSTHKTERFTDDLKVKLDAMKSTCVPGSIDAVIAGGMFGHPVRQKAYVDTIHRLSTEVEKILHFEPYVMAGPKLGVGDEAVYYDTPLRKAYVVRPDYSQSDRTNRGYKPRNIRDVSLSWKNPDSES